MNTSDLPANERLDVGRTRREWIGPVLIVIVLIIAAATYLVVRDSSSDVEVSGCRGLYRADIDNAAAELSATTSEGLQAAVTDDQVALDKAIEKLPQLRKDLRTSTQTYLDAVEMSLNDTSAFLEECATKF